MKNEWTVNKEEAGLKLVPFLKMKLPLYSSRVLKRAVEGNLCTINGMTERFASTELGVGDKVFFEDSLLQRSESVSVSFSADRVLFEDDDLMVYNKPAGISSEAIKTPYILVHRLDKETTGALIFAKSQPIFNAMVELFRKFKVHKTYVAIVQGVPKQKKGIIDNYLGKKSSYQGQAIWGQVVKEKGLHAVTEWQVEKVAKGATLIRCVPRTGRTHQLRVHLSEMGLPILGDHHYCRHFTYEYRPARVLLHAFEVSFEHPVLKTPLKIKAPLADDFKSAYKAIFSKA